MSGRYRYVGTRLYRHGETVEHGDVIEPTADELAAFGDLLEAVEEPAEPTEPTGEPEPTEPWEGYDDLTVAELRDAVVETSDEALRTALAYERANARRSTAIDAIESALEG